MRVFNAWSPLKHVEDGPAHRVGTNDAPFVLSVPCIFLSTNSYAYSFSALAHRLLSIIGTLIALLW